MRTKRCVGNGAKATVSCVLNEFLSLYGTSDSCFCPIIPHFSFAKRDHTFPDI